MKNHLSKITKFFNRSKAPVVEVNNLATNPSEQPQRSETYYSTIYNRAESNRFRSNFNLKSSLSAFSGRFNSRSQVKKVGTVVGLIVIILLGGMFLSQSLFSNSSSSSASSGEKIEIQGAKSTQDLNTEFTFPLKNEKGEEVNKIKYTIENAELRDEIIVKGQRANAVKGRTFLILNVKIVNEHNQSINISTKDYVRLSVNSRDDELLAPDIHNDPVEVQAISTKYTRLGFPINDTDKSLKLHVGEIKGEKQVVDLNLKQ